MSINGIVLDDLPIAKICKEESVISLFDGRTIRYAARKEKDEFISIVSELSDVVAKSFGNPLTDAFKADIHEHITNVDGLAVLRESGILSGFASAKYLPEDGVFYLHGIAIRNGTKGKGAGLGLTQALMAIAPKHTRVAYTTQNPIMFCFMEQLCGHVYPNPSGAIAPAGLYQLGKKLLEERGENFDAESFVVRNLYDVCKYPSIPASKNEEVNAWFAKSLNIGNGQSRDGFLLIGEAVRV